MHLHQGQTFQRVSRGDEKQSGPADPKQMHEAGAEVPFELELQMKCHLSEQILQNAISRIVFL
jgi:hypothetical protein